MEHDDTVHYEISSSCCCCFTHMWVVQSHVPQTVFRSNSKSHQNLEYSGFHWRDVCKISFWSAEYTMNKSITKFRWIPNSIEISLLGPAPCDPLRFGGVHARLHFFFSLSFKTRLCFAEFFFNLDYNVFCLFQFIYTVSECLIVGYFLVFISGKSWRTCPWVPTFFLQNLHWMFVLHPFCLLTDSMNVRVLRMTLDCFLFSVSIYFGLLRTFISIFISFQCVIIAPFHLIFNVAHDSTVYFILEEFLYFIWTLPPHYLVLNVENFCHPIFILAPFTVLGFADVFGEPVYMLTTRLEGKTCFFIIMHSMG